MTDRGPIIEFAEQLTAVAEALLGCMDVVELVCMTTSHLERLSAHPDFDTLHPSNRMMVRSTLAFFRELRDTLEEA